MKKNEEKIIKGNKISKENQAKESNKKNNKKTKSNQSTKIKKTNTKKETKEINKKTSEARNKRRNRSKNKKYYDSKLKKETTENIITNNKSNKKTTNKKTTKIKTRKKNNKKKKIILIIVAIVLVITSIIAFYTYNQIKEAEKIKQAQTKLQEDITSHYNQYVITTKETDLYKLDGNKYTKSGTLGINQELELEKIEITYKDEYLKVLTFNEEYYIYYNDIKKLEELSKISDRYKKYIPFNENIITKEVTNFYDELDNLVYSFNKSFEFPIIVKETNKYGIEYNNRLLYINKEDVSETKENKNTDKINTKGIAVFNYHFFYDETQASERKECNQSICHSKSLFESHLKYIKENEIFTPKMKEFEMYLDKKINLPKSVLITIDDGWRATIGERLLEQYQLNGTTFLITSWYDKIDFLNNSEYIELHSHGDNLHNQGVCPGGQGGGIKCIEKSKLQADLKLSREKLGGSTVFCYPFYEYNSYSIQNLKEAGFTMAFREGFQKAVPGVNKYEIPRYVIYNNTSVSQIANYIK